MSDLPAEKQAAKAIAHTLLNINTRPGVAWYLGHGTQTYALLTEAHATLHGITMAEAQENWPPADQPKFENGNLNPCPFCGSTALSGGMSHATEIHLISCTDCGAKGPSVDEFDYDSESEAIEAAVRKWNERQMPR